MRSLFGAFPTRIHKVSDEVLYKGSDKSYTASLTECFTQCKLVIIHALVVVFSKKIKIILSEAISQYQRLGVSQDRLFAKM